VSKLSADGNGWQVSFLFLFLLLPILLILIVIKRIDQNHAFECAACNHLISG
jgi:hypothetical protein